MAIPSTRDQTSPTCRKKFRPATDRSAVAFLGDSYDYIPTFDMPGKMGRALARAAEGAPGTNAAVHDEERFQAGPGSGRPHG